MTVSINFIAEQVGMWATANKYDHKGQVVLFTGGRPCGYLTSDNARHLAAELLREADEADKTAKGA